MAYIFRSLGGSNMSKRLLKYALSRIDVLDTESLDMDKLDLAWGANNVVTFQDVGIKLQKLEQLLQLPSSFKLEKAKVLKLRVTIPSSISVSPIVEVDGVQIKLKIASEETRPSSRKPAKTSEKEPDILPHAMDLAQSFLENETSTEKAELQKALDAENQDLAASVASSSEDSEDDMLMGTGQPLSLPGAVASYLQGIVDRTQVTIRGVTFQLDVEVPVEVHSTVPELVTFELAIDDINVEGVTTQVPMNVSESQPAVQKDGKRRIALNQIRASLISEADVFSTLARTPSMVSSAAPSSPVATERRPLSRESSLAPREDHEPLQYSTDSAHSQYHQAMLDSEDAFDIPYAEDPEDDVDRSAPSTPRAAPQRNSPPPDLLFRPAQSTVAQPSDRWTFTGQDVRSVPALGRFRWGEGSERFETAPMNLSESVNSNDSSTPLGDDLAESHLFSHEEAASMYMSALSNADSLHVPQAMPGTWDSASSSSENSPNTKTTETAPEPVPGSAVETEAEANPADEVTFQPATADVPCSLPRTDGHEDLGEASQSEEGEPAQETAGTDEVATPRGPTRLVKEIVSLSSVSVYVPSSHSPVTEPFDAPAHSSLDHSISPNVPGAFSVYGAAQSTASLSPPSPAQPAAVRQTEPRDNSIEILLAPLDIRFDASISFLLAMVVSRILSIVKDQSSQGQKMEASKEASTFPDIKVTAEQISVQFLETLAGVADISERIFNTEPQTFGHDTLLTTSLRNLTINVSRIETSTVTSVNLERFKFGYANDDIITFDPRLQMRASVRDAFPAAGADVSLVITQTPDETRCVAKTLPLHVKLDLQRLDETFSWFGGLSSFLNMGASMTSSASPTSRSPTRTTKKPRGVRFDAPIRADDKSAASENKFDVRVGGFHLDLSGKDCGVSLDTSAVKLVLREEGIGIGITKIELAGPFLKNSMGEPPIHIVVRTTRIEFLDSPRDEDLERLLELITPSKNKFDEDDDKIIVDTLLRQRRKGAVLRLNVDNIEVNVTKIPQLQCLPALGEELSRLGTVAKYLPEDDRPGILTLTMVRSFDLAVDVDRRFGRAQASLKDLEIGHITIPSLTALAVSSLSVWRNDVEELVGSTNSAPGDGNQGPVLTMRMIPGDLEPEIKLRLRRINIEYRVPTIMDILGLAEDATPQDFETQLAASVASLGEHAHTAITGRQPMSPTDKGKAKAGTPTKVHVALRDCLLGLNPLGLTSKMNIVLTDAHVKVELSNGDDAKTSVHLNKASVLLIDDISLLDSPPAYPSRRRTSNAPTPQVVELCSKGYVDICYIGSAKATVLVGANSDDGSKFVDVELRDDLLVLETCADSTQTMIALASALTPPMPPEKTAKYRTEIVPVEDLLASISADAFGSAEGAYDFDDDFSIAQEIGGEDLEGVDLEDSSQSSPLDIDSRFYDDPLVTEQLVDAADSIISHKTSSQDTNDGVLLTNFSSQPSMMDDEELVIHDNYFGAESVIKGTAHRWNSAKNAYDQSNDDKVQRSPITLRVRDVHVIWNLFDGYDWHRTREIVTKTVEDVEAKALERQARGDHPHITAEMDVIEEEETVIGDFLFNSIYIGIPANRDPRELAQRINQELNDNATETESIATTAMTATPSRMGSKRPKNKLKLNRSKRHKITFELKGINADVVSFPPGSGETQASIDVRVKDICVFDHVPTSTWKMFATYDQDAGEREMGTSMAHIELLVVKPVPELAASEMVLKVSVLPLRLHVDQDALDFLTRFMEFKDASSPAENPNAEKGFIQRAEINSIPVKLDFKPKRVDYAGLRSGHTSEFMNFLILDEARMTLRHTIVYGVSSFERLGKMLNDIWMPDIKRNQLPGILAGLAPVRSFVNVGSGFKNLIEVPVKEYKKDGKIVRSIGKGAAAFAKTTGTELVKLGAKMAVGTQYVLQGAEGMLVAKPLNSRETGWDDEDLDTEETKQISLYADQPTSMVQGVRGAYASLARDLNVARDAIIAVPGEVMESQSAQGAAKAILKRAPTIVLRPLIGSSKAIGKTLMGATNSLDPHNMRRMDEKYKKH